MLGSGAASAAGLWAALVGPARTQARTVRYDNMTTVTQSGGSGSPPPIGMLWLSIRE